MTSIDSAHKPGHNESHISEQMGWGTVVHHVPGRQRAQGMVRARDKNFLLIFIIVFVCVHICLWAHASIHSGGGHRVSSIALYFILLKQGLSLKVEPHWQLGGPNHPPVSGPLSLVQVIMLNFFM